MAKTKPRTDERGILNPDWGGESPDEHHRRIRADYLPDNPHPESPDGYEPSGAEIGIAAETIGSKKLSRILKQGVKSGEEFTSEVESALYEEQETIDNLDRLREQMNLGQGDNPAFWDAAKKAQQELDSERARLSAKAEKLAAIGRGAVVSEAGTMPGEPDRDSAVHELAEIQGGIHGSPASPKNKKRRAELKAQLRS